MAARRLDEQAIFEVARKIDSADTRRKGDIEKGASVSDLVTRKYK